MNMHISDKEPEQMSRGELLSYVAKLEVSLELKRDDDREAGKRRLMAAYNISPAHAALLEALATRDLLTREVGLMVTARGARTDDRDPKIVDVFICRLRQVLRDRGISIENVWGAGYYLSEGRALVKSVLSGAA